MIDPDNPERDPVLADAWRAHSAEMPPAELDAAILAAAHRAVGSAPQGSAQRAAAGTQSPDATRPQRWWMPLAAAATIGAIALGILQTVPQEPPVTTHSATDMPAPATSQAVPAHSASEMPAPMPLPPPVTSATRPSRAPDMGRIVPV